MARPPARPPCSREILFTAGLAILAPSRHVGRSATPTEGGVARPPPITSCQTGAASGGPGRGRRHHGHLTSAWAAARERRPSLRGVHEQRPCGVVIRPTRALGWPPTTDPPPPPPPTPQRHGGGGGVVTAGRSTGAEALDLGAGITTTFLGLPPHGSACSPSRPGRRGHRAGAAASEYFAMAGVSELMSTLRGAGRSTAAQRRHPLTW